MRLDRRSIIDRVERDHARRRAEAEPLLGALRSALPKATASLRRNFTVQRVLLFGSFGSGIPTPSSDVDLAVEGLPARDHFRAMAYLTEALGRTVDLVRLEDLSPRHRQRVLDESVAA